MSSLLSNVLGSSLLQKLGAVGGLQTSAWMRGISGCSQDVFNYRRKVRIDHNPTWLRKHKPKKQAPESFHKLVKANPIQKWEDYNGFGNYQYRHHDYPTNWTLRDVQRRRVFKNHAQDRLRVNAIRKADMLPQELRRLADEEIHTVPRDSAITRPNRRCSITGRARGVFHQFRVSRFVFRAQADYNKVSGAIYAKWNKGIDIDP